MSLLQSVFTPALAAIRKLIGVPIVYGDGVHTCSIALAGVGKTEYELDDGNGIIESWTARDYLVNRTDIVLNAIQTLPLKNHTITEVINGVTKVFAVLAPPGKQVYEFSDPGQTQLRIHTQEIS